MSKISTTLGITMIVVVAFIIGGGVLAYQYWWLPKQEVESSIKVVSPNGGENWILGSTQTIRWISTENISQVTISLMPIDSSVGTRLIGTVANSGSYSWTIPNCYPGNECSSNFQIPTGNYKIQISISDIRDQSDAPFSIVTAGTLSATVLSPNGGETWAAGSTQYIKFKSNLFGKDVILIYYKEPDYSIIGQTKTSNDGSAVSFKWQIPTTVAAGSDYIINVTIQNPGIPGVEVISDQSDAQFSIVAAGTPSITVISPNGGETWEMNSIQTIRWSAPTSVSEVKINLLYLVGLPVLSGPSEWTLYRTIGIVKNTGSFEWRVDESTASSYKIEIRDVNNVVLSDASDAAFSIIK